MCTRISELGGCAYRENCAAEPRSDDIRLDSSQVLARERGEPLAQPATKHKRPRGQGWSCVVRSVGYRQGGRAHDAQTACGEGGLLVGKGERRRLRIGRTKT
jgi:hypothetical protein